MFILIIIIILDFHFMPHKVEKTQPDNKRAQIVYNQFHQCLHEQRKEGISILLLLLRSDCCDFVTILERDSVFSTLCPIKYRSKNMTPYSDSALRLFHHYIFPAYIKINLSRFFHTPGHSERERIISVD